jgi:hypothetical protein
MKDIVTPVPPEEVRSVIKKCLENAALVNYTRVSEYAKIEGLYPMTICAILCFIMVCSEMTKCTAALYLYPIQHDLF